MKKNFFERKSFQLICKGKIFKTVCGKYFKTNGSRDIQLLVISRFRKIAPHTKAFNKTRATKNQENSANLVGENYLTNQLAKFLQGRIKH